MKNDFQEFVVYIEAKKFSRHYHLKILSHARKLSKSIYFFSYKELTKHRELLLKDAFFKSVRNICNFYEEKYLDDDETLREIAKIRRLAKRKESGQPDVYTPTESELQTHLETIKGLSHKVYNFYLGLMYSGVRVVEFGRWVDNPTAFRTIDMGNFVKILVNSKRGLRNVTTSIYLNSWLIKSIAATNISFDFVKNTRNY